MDDEARETPESVAAWLQSEFGTIDLNAQITKAHEEMRELADAMRHGESPEAIAFEVADVIICLFPVLHALYPEAIEHKMRINRSRQWGMREDGTAQHI